MWLSFWVAVLLGLLSALPVLNKPELEGLWLRVGLIATVIVNAVSPKPPKMETVVLSVDPPISFQAPARQQETLAESVGGYISGLLVDIAAYFVSGIVVILVILVAIGGEKAKEKRRALFPLFWDKGPRP